MRRELLRKKCQLGVDDIDPDVITVPPLLARGVVLHQVRIRHPARQSDSVLTWQPGDRRIPVGRRVVVASAGVVVRVVELVDEDIGGERYKPHEKKYRDDGRRWRSLGGVGHKPHNENTRDTARTRLILRLITVVPSSAIHSSTGGHRDGRKGQIAQRGTT